MFYPADGNKEEDGGRGLVRAFSILLSKASFPSHDPLSRPFQTEKGGGKDLHWLLSADRKRRGSDVELLQSLSGKGNCTEPDLSWIESSLQALLILDENRFVFCCSAGAKRLLALGEEANGRIFHYFFQPCIPQLITIERPNRTVGVGRLLAVTTRWEGREVYLVTIRDVTHLERERIVMQLSSIADKQPF